MKKESKKTTKPINAGFGFGDALFAMKDMQMDYANIGNPYEQIPPPMIQPSIKKQVPKPPVKKVQTTKKVLVSQPTNQSHKTQNFVVNPGKEFQPKKQTVVLQNITVISHQQFIHELTHNGNIFKPQYFVFCQGQPVKNILPTPQISFKFTLEDVKQGQLGNCYFICALASVTLQHQILMRRILKFSTYDLNKAQSFKVNLFESGKYVEMPVDNAFPQVYCKPAGNDIAPMIIEKAYAQLYGKYQILNIGHACDSMRDLTGGFTQYITLKDYITFRAKILQAFKKKFPLAIASKANPSQNVSPKHSYNILDYDEINGKLFLKLRDPRGWTKASFPLPGKLEVQSQLLRGNGIFFIDFQNLCKNFEVISVCKIFPKYHYYYHTFSSKDLLPNSVKPNPYSGAILMKIEQPMHGAISIHQRHKKKFDQKFSYDIIKLMIAEVSTKNELKIIKTISCDFNCQQVCCKELNLQAGQYIIIGEIGNNLHKVYVDLNQLFTLSIYISTPPEKVSFQIIKSGISVNKFLGNYIKENKEMIDQSTNKKMFAQTLSDKGLLRIYGDCFGYVCIYYENKGNKEVIEQITYENVKNVTISEKKINLKPNASYLIKNPIGNSSNGSHACSIKTKTLYRG